MDLFLNPSLRITPIEEQGPAYAITAAVKGRGLRKEVLSQAKQRELFTLLERLLGRAGREPIELTNAQERALRRLGILVSPRQVPGSVQLLHLPKSGTGRPSRGAPPHSLQLNPAALITERSTAPILEQSPEFGERLSSRRKLAWVPERRTGALIPVHLGPRHLQIVNHLVSAPKAASQRYPPALVAQLEATGILLPRSGSRQPPVGPSEDERQSFQKHGYAIIEALFSRSFCLALATYIRALRVQGFLQAGDAQVPLRNILHAEAVTTFLHRQLSPFVEAMVGCRVKPSYCYTAEYMPGAVLQRHVDRPQCEFTISLLADFNPRPKGKCSWPLWLSPTGKDRLGVRLAIGDAVLYKGRRIAHWRNALSPGKRSISIFFHFVPEDFTQPLT